VTDAVRYLAEMPSPTTGGWYIGPFLLRAYALCILLGIVAACAIAEVRLRQRGAPKWLVLDIAVWAVPFGIVGGRIYHVITSPQAYFGANGDPLKAFAIWEGGLGIWGAVALGGVGAWLACRRRGLPLTFFADALAPGLPVAQAIGRFGNWFNNELYGGPTTLPWGLKIYQFDLGTAEAKRDEVTGEPILVDGGPFHPTFLYEAVWNVGVAVLVWLVDRRWKLGRGRAFALYVMAYTVGRFWIEAMRTDEASIIAGMRVNNWVSILVFLGALVYFVRVKGPQEHVRQEANGRLVLVTAEGEPILGRVPAPAGSDASRTDEPGDDPPDDDKPSKSEPAESEPAGSEAAEDPAGADPAGAEKK
jgi:prolipoprotein diacylglyceryl transferase